MQALLTGQRVLITQADAFMGPALCEAFAARGATVIASTESLVDPAAGLSFVHLRFAENRCFSGREVRFWSIDRPWAAPVVQRPVLGS